VVPEEINAGMKAGFRNYLTKPLDVPNLIRTIKETLAD
jgi:CheY-like chemotaxis protein